MGSLVAIGHENADGTIPDFGTWLIAREVLTKSAYERAMRNVQQTNERLIPLLSKLGLVTEEDLVKELSVYYKMPAFNIKDIPSQPLFIESINKRFLLLHYILPVAVDGDKLVIATADPGDDAAQKAIQFFSRKNIICCVGALSEIEKAIERLYGGKTQGASPIDNGIFLEDQSQDDINRLAELASDAPVIKTVHNMIMDAVALDASDIHIEPFIDRVRIRYRIDGVLCEQAPYPRQLNSAIVSRIKVMARLNIAERRMPQDGSTRFAVQGREVDLRISTCPTVYGESVVLRILDRGNTDLDFQQLGFDAVALEQTLELLRRPNGILLVTGPTGSGKTTTLYAALSLLNTPERKILTVEDPIEYKIDGINQQEVMPQINRTFANALRSFLRQDPDVLLVGEIRDEETARIAIQAALTGHLVLSTLHTNSAAGAVTRLLEMGIENYLLASTISGVLGQRLVRKLCKCCRESYTPSSDLVEKVIGNSKMNITNKITLFRPIGCDLCHGSGYQGRTIIAEVLSINETLCQLILNKADIKDIHRAGVESGMRTIYQHGLQKALEGETTLEEVFRVVQEM